MKAPHLLITLFLCFCTNITFAQEDNSFKTITIPISKDSTFDKLIDYLQTEEIFIQSVDKQAGFIQGRVFIKDKRIFSAKAGEQRTMNFILRPMGDRTKVSLSIYKEDYYFGGDVSSKSYYYKDAGIMDDATVYRGILDGLQKSVGQ